MGLFGEKKLYQRRAGSGGGKPQPWRTPGSEHLRRRLITVGAALVVLAAVAGASPGVASATTTISPAPVSFSVPEGVVFSGAVATFTDSNSFATAGSFTATIDWGDGLTDTGTITSARTGFIVSGTHTYIDESSPVVVVTIHDQAPGTGAGTATHTDAVTEADSFTGSAVCSGPTDPGVSHSRTVATFSDANTNQTVFDLTATIDWGDGTTSGGVVTGSNGSFSVSGAHTYASAGSDTITVTLNDDAPGTATAQVVTTTGACISTATGHGVSTTEGASASGTVATFTDSTASSSASAYSATIDWGDGSAATPGTVTGSGSSFSVSGSHTYADEGTYPIAVTITATDASGHAATTSSAASVADADAVDSPAGVSPSPASAHSFNGVVATFSDPYPGASGSDFAATIDWGDGTNQSIGTVTGSPTSFAVSGSHTYVNPGAYAIVVHITDLGGASGDAISHYTVLGPPTIQIKLPADRAQLQFRQRLTASYSCQDDPHGPGIHSCIGSVASGSPINTSAPGVHTFTVTATSADGQSASKTVTYKVFPNNAFTIRLAKPRSNGAFTASLRLPGSGKVQLAATTGRRVAFARAHATARRAGTLPLAVTPNRRGRLLVKHHHHPITLKVSITFTPTGGHAHTIHLTAHLR